MGGFLDLLGYQQDLEATDVFPPPSRDDALKLFQGVVNRRLAFVQGPRVVLAATASTRPPDRNLSEADEQLRTHLSTVRVSTTGFSDSVILQTPLDDVEKKAPMVALSELVMASALSLVSHLAIESPMRGGIDIALGMWTSGQLHSAATAKAVNLEKRGGYPRILVGKRFIDYLDFATNTPDGAPRPYLTHRTLATELKSILYSDPGDDEGSPPGIDYMGESFRQLMPALDPDLVRDAWRFAKKSHAIFKEKKDRKLEERYERLMAYMEPRLRFWGLNPSS